MVKKLDPFDAIENGFSLLKKKPIIFFIALVIPILSFLYDYYFLSYQSSEELWNFWYKTSKFYYRYYNYDKLSNIILFVFLLFLLNTFISSLLIKIAYEKKVDISKAIKFVIAKYPTLLISTIFFVLILGFGFLALIIPGIFLLIKLLFYQYAIIIENKGVVTSLERSWEITNGNGLRIFGLGIFLFIIALFFGFINILLYFISNWVGVLFNIISQAFLSSLSTTTFLEAYIKLSGKR